MPDLLERTATCIIYEKGPYEIRKWLLAHGLTEAQAFYTYIGAKMIAKTRMATA